MSPEELQSIAEALQVFSELTASRPNEWLPVYAALGGAVAGAIASFLPTWFIERRREAAFAKQIENCLLAEISALIDIIDRRGYLAGISEAVETLRQCPEGAVWSFKVDVPSHYSRVYQDNCKHVGVIQKDIAHQVVIFHQLIDAVVQDIKPNGVLSYGATLDGFMETELIFKQAVEIGRKLSNRHS